MINMSLITPGSTLVLKNGAELRVNGVRRLLSESKWELVLAMFEPVHKEVLFIYDDQGHYAGVSSGMEFLDIISIKGADNV